MPSESSKRILIAPLDWGLGHTTRCLPLAAYLQGLGHTVVMAGNDWQRSFIKRSIPGIETLSLEGYNIHYSRTGPGFKYRIATQVPKILAAIKKEQDWLIEQSARQNFDGIISDNRYGLHHPRIPSVILTHQLAIQSGMGGLVNNMIGNMHYKLIDRFRECWVVDTAIKPSLSGRLAHPLTLPKHAKYIGLLSQFENTEPGQNDEQHLLILLSGPEPQRTALSKILWAQAKQHKGKIVFVEGKENVVAPTDIPAHIAYHVQLSKEALLPLIQQAQIVICRSGYSSLMDLAALQKKAILIPTPGQTEQLYLARHLQQEGMFYSAKQNGFKLADALSAAASFPFRSAPPQASFSTYKEVLNSWSSSL